MNPTERSVARICAWGLMRLCAWHLFMAWVKDSLPSFLAPSASFCGQLINTDGKNSLDLIGHLRLQEESKVWEQDVVLEHSIRLACVRPWVQFPSTEKGKKVSNRPSEGRGSSTSWDLPLAVYGVLFLAGSIMKARVWIGSSWRLASQGWVVGKKREGQRGKASGKRTWI